MQKTFTIGQILTKEELQKAFQLYQQHKDDGQFARLCCQELIEPNMERINKALGQENVPMFLAYAVEYAMMQAQ